MARWQPLTQTQWSAGQDDLIGRMLLHSDGRPVWVNGRIVDAWNAALASNPADTLRFEQQPQSGPASVVRVTCTHDLEPSSTPDDSRSQYDRLLGYIKPERRPTPPLPELAAWAETSKSSARSGRP
jgi:hypothetical protein